VGFAALNPPYNFILGSAGASPSRLLDFKGFFLIFTIMTDTRFSQQLKVQVVLFLKFCYCTAAFCVMIFPLRLLERGDRYHASGVYPD